MKKLLDPRHTASSNDGPCHWTSLPSVAKQRGGGQGKDGGAEPVEGDRKALYLECGGSYVGVYIYQNSSNHTLNMGVFYCIQVIPQTNTLRHQSLGLTAGTELSRAVHES